MSLQEIKGLSKDQIPEVEEQIRELWGKYKQEEHDKRQEEPEGAEESEEMTYEKAMRHVQEGYLVVTSESSYAAVNYCNKEVKGANPDALPMGANASYHHMTGKDTSAQTLEDAIVSDIFRSMHNGFFIHEGKTFVPTTSPDIVEYARESGIKVLEV